MSDATARLVTHVAVTLWGACAGFGVGLALCEVVG